MFSSNRNFVVNFFSVINLIKMPRSTKSVLAPKNINAPISVSPPKSEMAQAPSFLQTVKEGMAFGTGSTVARTMIERTLLPPGRIDYEPCYTEHRVYERCLINQDERAYCKDYRDEYEKCIKITEKKLS